MRPKDVPIFPCLRVRLLVDVPGGNLSHFHEPTRSYLCGSEDELASAKSTVTLTWVSTRDLVPPSGMLGNIIGRLRDKAVQYHMKYCHTRTSNALETCLLWGAYDSLIMVHYVKLSRERSGGRNRLGN